VSSRPVRTRCSEYDIRDMARYFCYITVMKPVRSIRSLYTFFLVLTLVLTASASVLGGKDGDGAVSIPDGTHPGFVAVPKNQNPEPGQQSHREILTKNPHRVGTVTLQQLKGMIERKEQVLVVDVRTDYEYNEGHIPGSVNIPSHRMKDLQALLPKDKTYPIVFYCTGAG
jgi:hypothetical protein